MAHPPDILARLAARGAQLREVRGSLLRQTPGTRQRWFQGPDGCDLFLWYDDVKGLSQLQLTFEDLAVEWSLEAGVRTSQLKAIVQGGMKDDGGRLAHDRAADPETLELARALLSQASVDEVTLRLVEEKLGLRRINRP